MELADLFAILCRTSSIAPQLAYGSAMAFSARRDMLIAASQSFFSFMPFEKEDFDKLIDEVGKLNGRRNDIAHGTVINYSGSYGSGYYLGPPPYNFSRSHLLIGGGHKYQYTSDQIISIKDIFNTYSGRLKMLQLDLVRAQRAWQETHPEPLSELEDQECPEGATPQPTEPPPQVSDPSPQSDH